jgi:hypothetical protein
VKNGFNSWFRGWIGFEGMDSKWRQEQLLMPRTELLPFLTIFGTTMRAKPRYEEMSLKKGKKSQS